MLPTLKALLGANPYPGRGVLLGRSESGKAALAAYFLMGRSENSRNRILVRVPDGVRTQAFDPARVTDPSLILYAPVRYLPDGLIVTNGDHTDTVAACLARGASLEAALDTREYEPDAPHYTPRIAGLLRVADGGVSCRLAILRRDAGGACERAYFPAFAPAPGEGRLLHTYAGDGDPLPPFAGAPRAVALPETARELATALYRALDARTRVAVYACAVDLATGTRTEHVINRLEEPDAGH